MARTCLFRNRQIVKAPLSPPRRQTVSQRWRLRFAGPLARKRSSCDGGTVQGTVRGRSHADGSGGPFSAVGFSPVRLVWDAPSGGCLSQNHDADPTSGWDRPQQHRDCAAWFLIGWPLFGPYRAIVSTKSEGFSSPGHDAADGRAGRDECAERSPMLAGLQGVL